MTRVAASFRDPSGFLFTQDGVLFRQVNQAYAADYDLLMKSGLYAALVKSGSLIAHKEVNQPAIDAKLAYKTIQPEQVRFISYPYEWSFSQLQDAALLTLQIQRVALDKDMTLKDANAYNIQFHHGKPILIDTLSFEAYEEGKPWVPYRQFCQHFLAPLALMALKDIRLSQLLRVYIDGVPLDLASELLPGKTRFSIPLLTHIHLHASAQKRHANKAAPQPKPSKVKFSKIAMLGLVDSLEGAVRGLKWQPGGTEWGDYYDATNYTDSAFLRKKELVGRFLQSIKPASVWDLGANTGLFTRVASEMGIPAIAFDIDPTAVEQGYRDIRAQKEANLLPLVLDLTNPSPALGWANQERESLAQRGPVDVVMVLALVHHLAISNNVPLVELARFFASLGKHLIIEFVPKDDSQVQRLLSSRRDIFPDYTQVGFEEAFQTCFTIRAAESVEGSKRNLYWMERIEA